MKKMNSDMITPVNSNHRVLLCPYCITRPEYHVCVDIVEHIWMQCPKCGLASFSTPAGRKRARQKWNRGEWKNNIPVERFKSSPFNPWAAFGKNFGNPSQTATDVAHLLLTRDMNGHSTYHKSLDRDDLGLEAWIQHALEEALDLACYLKRLMPIIEMRMNKDKEYEGIITANLTEQEGRF